MENVVEIVGCQEYMPQKVAAVVVLYYPDDNVKKNILSYINQVDLVILVDNSEEPSNEFIDRFFGNSKVLTVINGDNLGIAAALNIGAREAIAKGFDLLLTMDQDSCATTGMVDTLRNSFKSPEGNLLAIASPFHLTTIADLPGKLAPAYTEMETVWTSGNLLRLSAYKEVGPFNESLFIDFVDHEYCLRLKRKGYRIIQSNQAVLQHNIGNDLRKIDIGLMSFKISNHSPLRRYYITRNRFRVTKEYREFKRFFWIDRRRFMAECLTILMFESQKFEKLKMMVRGYVDYRSGRMGKFLE